MNAFCPAWWEKPAGRSKWKAIVPSATVSLRAMRDGWTAMAHQMKAPRVPFPQKKTAGFV